MSVLITVFQSAIWQLYQHRWTTLLCVASLAVSITLIASTASIVDHTLFRPMPFHEAYRLVMIRMDNPEENLFDDQVSVIDFADWELDCKTMDITAFNLGRIDLPYEGGYERLIGLYVSPSFFDVLNIKPYLGQDFRDYHYTGNNEQIMLSPRVWRNHLQGDAMAMGNIVKINTWASWPDAGSLDYQLSGILPEGLRCVPSRVIFVDDQGIGVNRELDFVLPAYLLTGSYDMRRFHGIDAMGRLKPGVTLAQAQAEMEVIVARLEQRFPQTNKGWRVRLVPMHEYVAGEVRPFVLATLLAAFLVFVIAIANVVHMLLVQYQQRQGEMAIRAAVGASPGAIFSQVFLEFALIVGLGFGLGIAAATWCTPALLSMAPDKLRWLPTELSFNAILAAAVLTGVAGLFIWWLALRRVVSPNLAPLLGASSQTSSADKGAMTALGRMTQIQLVATYFLIVAAGVLFLRIRQIASVDPGFEPKHRLAMSLSLPSAKYEWNHNSIFNHAVVERLRDVPGVINSAAILGMPMGNNPLVAQIVIEGRPQIRPGDLPPAFIRVITDDYFKTMGIPLIYGRMFEESDKIGEIAQNKTAIVSKSLAEKCWPGLDPIGRRFKPFDRAQWMEVVGVVGDVCSDGIERGRAIDIYYPEKLYPQSSPNLVVHTSIEPMAMAAAIRDAILEVDADANVTDIRTMESVIIDSQAERYFGLRLLSVLSAIGFGLALCGIIATASHSISRRANELLVRVACGASPTDILNLVVGEQLKLVGIGLGAAILVAAMIGPSLGLSWKDEQLFRQLALVGVPCLLVAASLISSYLIAARAAFTTRPVS